MSNPNPNTSLAFSTSTLRSSSGDVNGHRSLATIVSDYLQLVPDETSTIESVGEFAKQDALAQSCKTKLETLLSKLFDFEEKYDTFFSNSEFVPRLSSSNETIIRLDDTMSLGDNTAFLFYQPDLDYYIPGNSYFDANDFDNDDLLDAQVGPDNFGINSATVLTNNSGEYDRIEIDVQLGGSSTSSIHGPGGPFEYIRGNSISPYRIRVTDSNGGAFDGDYPISTSTNANNIIIFSGSGPDFPSDISTFSYQKLTIDEDSDSDNDGISDSSDSHLNRPLRHVAQLFLKIPTDQFSASERTQYYWTKGVTTATNSSPGAVLDPTNGGAILTTGSNDTPATSLPSASAAAQLMSKDSYGTLNPPGTYSFNTSSSYTNQGDGSVDYSIDYTRVIEYSGTIANYTSQQFGKTLLGDNFAPNYYYLHEEVDDIIDTLDGHFDNIEANIAALEAPMIAGTQGIKFSPNVGDPAGTLNSAMSNANKSANTIAGAIYNVKNGSSPDDSNEYALAYMNATGQGPVAKLNTLSTTLTNAINYVDSLIVDFGLTNTSPLKSRVDDLKRGHRVTAV